MQFLANGLIAGSVYALVGLSFALIFTTAGFFHVGHGVVFAWGAYFAYVFHILLGLPLVLSVALAAIATAGLGAGLELLVFRRLRQRVTALVLLVASLGLYVVLQNLLSLFFGDRTRSLLVSEATEGVAVLGARLTVVQIMMVCVCVVLVAAVGVLLRRTKLGKALRAVANDRELASVCGIEADGIILYAFIMGSALAGVAGSLVALDVGMMPTMGMRALLMGVVAVIIGGVGRIPGVILGGLLLGMAQSLGAWGIGSQWQDTIAFVILLAFLLFRPQGFLGRAPKKAYI